jgi:antitoxin (DNA-binding transcriptional repressor) of toxin-antitoxin stability system
MSPLPKKDFRGQSATLSMMELRKRPGDAVDRVEYGMRIDIEKNGKLIASLVPPDGAGDTVIYPDGRISGAIPLTFRLNLGSGGYGE